MITHGRGDGREVLVTLTCCCDQSALSRGVNQISRKTILGEGTYKYIKYINDMQFCWQISLKSVFNEADKSPNLGGEHVFI